LHAEVLKRAEKIKTAPYAGFIQPEMEAVVDANGTITDVKISYPKDLIGQMLRYGKQFSFLPDEN
jgi:dipeptidyl-peptidase-3